MEVFLELSQRAEHEQQKMKGRTDKRDDTIRKVGTTEPFEPYVCGMKGVS